MEPVGTEPKTPEEKDDNLDTQTDLENGQVEGADNADGTDVIEEVDVDAWLEGLGFKNLDDLAKSYKEAQKKITEQGQELSRVTRFVGDNRRAAATAQTPAQPDKEDANADEDFISNLVKDGLGTVRAVMFEVEDLKEEFSEYRDNLWAETMNDVLADEVEDDIREAMKEILGEEIFQNGLKHVNYRNFKTYDPKTRQWHHTYDPESVKAHWKQLASLARDAAYGRNAKKTVQDANAVARRDAKRRYTFGKKLNSMAPGGKGNSIPRKGTGTGEQYLETLRAMKV